MPAWASGGARQCVRGPAPGPRAAKAVKARGSAGSAGLLIGPVGPSMDCLVYPVFPPRLRKAGTAFRQSLAKVSGTHEQSLAFQPCHEEERLRRDSVLYVAIQVIEPRNLGGRPFAHRDQYVAPRRFHIWARLLRTDPNDDRRRDGARRAWRHDPARLGAQRAGRGGAAFAALCAGVCELISTSIPWT